MTQLPAPAQESLANLGTVDKVCPGSLGVSNEKRMRKYETKELRFAPVVAPPSPLTKVRRVRVRGNGKPAKQVELSNPSN